jgi:hypothetical protein
MRARQHECTNNCETIVVPSLSLPRMLSLMGKDIMLWCDSITPCRNTLNLPNIIEVDEFFSILFLIFKMKHELSSSKVFHESKKKHIKKRFLVLQLVRSTHRRGEHCGTR